MKFDIEAHWGGGVVSKSYNVDPAVAEERLKYLMTHLIGKMTAHNKAVVTIVVHKKA